MRVQEILTLIPDSVLDSLSQEAGIDKINNKLTGKMLFKLLLFSLGKTERVSLRTIEKAWNSVIFRQYVGNKNHGTVRHSGIADRLSKIEPVYFAAILDSLIVTYQKLIPKEYIHQLYIFDSTLIGISAKLFQSGLKVSRINEIKHLKFVVGLKENVPASVYFCQDQQEANENIAFKNAIAKTNINKEDVLVFDRGLIDSNYFVALHEAGLTFVGRLQKNRRYKFVETVNEPPFSEEKYISDHKGYLFTDRKYCVSQPCRIIRIKSSSQNEDVLLVTNNFVLKTEEISEIYKRRWDIEVFFRFVKQELNLKHFLAHNLNGMKVQIYMIMILAVLLRIYKISNKLAGYKFVKRDFFYELETEVIGDLIDFCGGNSSIFFEMEKSVTARQFL